MASQKISVLAQQVSLNASTFAPVIDLTEALTVNQNKRIKLTDFLPSQKTNGYVFIDGTNGSDALGVKYNINAPFKTINAGFASASTLDTLVVLKGTYNEDVGAGISGKSCNMILINATINGVVRLTFNAGQSVTLDLLQNSTINGHIYYNGMSNFNLTSSDNSGIFKGVIVDTSSNYSYHVSNLRLWELTSRTYSGNAVIPNGTYAIQRGVNSSIRNVRLIDIKTDATYFVPETTMIIRNSNFQNLTTNTGASDGCIFYENISNNQGTIAEISNCRFLANRFVFNNSGSRSFNPRYCFGNTFKSLTTECIVASGGNYYSCTFITIGAFTPIRSNGGSLEFQFINCNFKSGTTSCINFTGVATRFRAYNCLSNVTLRSGSVPTTAGENNNVIDVNLTLE